MRKSSIALLVAALLLSGCANEADAKDAAAALKFFRSAKEYCDYYALTIGSPGPAQSLFDKAEAGDVFDENGMHLVEIIDGKGQHLYVNLKQEQIYGGTRPDAVMPKPYVNVCPADMFLGVLYETEYQG